MYQDKINDPNEIWKAVLGQIEIGVSPMVYKSVISRTSGVDLDSKR